MNILEVENVVKENRPKTKIPKNSVCAVCGCSNSEFKMRNFNDWIVCEKHYNQLEKFGKITDPTPRQHKKEVEKCCICGDRKHMNFDGEAYCQKHYLQMLRHGKILERTIYSKNEYIEKDDYYEVNLYDVQGNFKGITLIDKDKKELLENYKIYMRSHDNKNYAAVNINSRKVLLHRFLLEISDEKYSVDRVVDHINGNSLDNRLCNLRICTQADNAKNMRKKDSITGVNFNKQNNKWIARIMKDYKHYQWTCNSKEEAILTRVIHEKELFGDYGPNRDLYYLINHPSPIEEIKIIFSEGA